MTLTDRTGTAFDIDAERITSVKNVKHSGDEEGTEITVDYVQKVTVNESFFEVIAMMTMDLTVGESDGKWC